MLPRYGRAPAPAPAVDTGADPPEDAALARAGLSEQEQVDIAFRVLADHARCVSCAIADGIMPGNDGRNYVIRRILRRGILYGRKDLGLSVGFYAAWWGCAFAVRAGRRSLG